MPAKKGKSSSSKASKKPSASKKKKDWFDELDAELEKKTEKAIEMGGGDANKKEDINKTLIEDFWKIVLRFEKINIHFSIEPSYSQFAQFDKFPFEWSLKDDFDYIGVKLIEIVDKTQDLSRVGDTLRFRYYKKDDKMHVRMSFIYCEGEHYYKYTGWKRIFSEYIAYDTTLKQMNMDNLHTILADVIRAWYESHLRRDRDVILKHLGDNYEKGETYSL